MKKKQNDNQIRIAWTAGCVWLLVLALSSCQRGHQSDASADVYTCPMHPSVVSDHASTCPVCGMDLVRKARPGEEVEMTPELARLTQSTNVSIPSDVSTVKGVYKEGSLAFPISGVVTYDDRKKTVLPSRVGGRLERVAITYPYQPVYVGQVIAEIYSPELATAQREMIFLLESKASTELINAARHKLTQLGFTERELSDLLATKKVQDRFPIVSAVSGFVVPASSAAPTLSVATPAEASGKAMGMGSTNGVAATSVPVAAERLEDFPRVGSYVSSGQTLFTVVAAQKCWIEFRATSDIGTMIKRGQLITLTDQQKVTADVVEPFSNESIDVIRIRSYFSGGSYRIGQLIEGKVDVDAKDALWLPSNAVVQAGDRNIVFVKERGSLRPRLVKIGLRFDNEIQILEGISSIDEIAYNGHFLVDSEGFINSTSR